MFLQSAIYFQCPFSASKEETSFRVFSTSAAAVPLSKQKYTNLMICSSFFDCYGRIHQWLSNLQCRRRMVGLRASKEVVGQCDFDNGKKDEEGNTRYKNMEDDSDLMDEEERKEWRRMIREVIEKNPHVQEETDPTERRKKMEKLLAEYPLVEEEDPDWPDDADGWGFNLGQFFNKITIKNNRKDDDGNYDSDKEFVWQDDNYILPIKDITTKEWEETVFKDISPLVVFVHNRYRRPKENEMARDGLEKAAHIFWNSRLPSPRFVAIDAVVELDLVSALKVSFFPEIMFIKAGKILYREKSVRTADEL